MVQRVKYPMTEHEQAEHNSGLMVIEGEVSMWKRAGSIFVTLAGGVIGLYYMAIGVGYALRWLIMYG